MVAHTIIVGRRPCNVEYLFNLISVPDGLQRRSRCSAVYVMSVTSTVQPKPQVSLKSVTLQHRLSAMTCYPRLNLLLLLLFLGGNSALAATENQCFANKEELKQAVNSYIRDGCAEDNKCEVGKKYGWPIGSWCVSKVTDVIFIF